MIIPTLRYRDAAAAIDFLERAFGFERVSVHEQDGRIAHAELRHGDGLVMLGSAGGGDPRWETDQDYGSREYAAQDPEGNVWSFGTYDPRG